jgi:hypothetical protein
VKKKYKK